MAHAAKNAGQSQAVGAMNQLQAAQDRRNPRDKEYSFECILKITAGEDTGTAERVTSL